MTEIGMRYWLAVLSFVFSSIAYAESLLYTGTDIPAGWANGFDYSLQSRAECQRLFDQIANDEPGKAFLKCKSRIDPRLPTPTATPQVICALDCTQ
jgi:hypothetical protein